MIKLIAIGDNNIDTYESGVSYAGGNCPNVAAYASINGYSSAYIGVLGKDAFGGLSARGLGKAGVDTSRVRFEEGITSRDVIVSKDGDRIFTDYDRSIIDAYPLRFSDEDLSFIGSYQLIHSSIYSAFAPGEFDKLCGLGVPVSFDFSVEWAVDRIEEEEGQYLSELKPVDENFLEDTCRKVDFAFLSCGHVSEEETIEVLKRCVGYGCRVAVGTRGMHGSYAFDGQDLWHQAAYETSVVDTLGAGDSFIARFLLTYMDGLTLLSECERAIGGSFHAEDRRDFLAKLTRDSMAQAALFASRSCQLEGAFGFGERIV